MAKRSPTQTVVCDGQTWQRQYTDDRSGNWLELAGPFGELIVDDDHGRGFAARWWPPGVRCCDSVLIEDGHKTQRAAMRAATAYLRQLSGLLAQAPAAPAPARRRKPAP